jgi:hypothetical protein
LPTIGSSSTGEALFTDEGAGAGACTICSATAERVAPENGSLPVSISNMTMPREKMSVRWSSCSPSACSGDMYATVSCVVPGAVTITVIASAAR